MFGFGKEKIRMNSLLGAGAVCGGEFTSPGSARIDGKVCGSATAEETLILGAGSVVDGNVTAKTAIIGGEVRGNVIAPVRVELTETAKVYGDITTAVIVIDEKAFFTGKCNMNPEAVEQAEAETASVEPVVEPEEKLEEEKSAMSEEKTEEEKAAVSEEKAEEEKAAASEEKTEEEKTAASEEKTDEEKSSASEEKTDEEKSVVPEEKAVEEKATDAETKVEEDQPSFRKKTMKSLKSLRGGAGGNKKSAMAAIAEAMKEVEEASESEDTSESENSTESGNSSESEEKMN